MRLLTDDVRYAESPRWHRDRLWFSDVHAYQLKTVDLQGHVTVIAEVPGRPAGLGVLPDSALLMATALTRRLYRVEISGEVREVADLSSLATGLLNDMVVDAQGRAYVGDTGFNMAARESPRPGRLLCWQSGSRPHVAAEDLNFPNGCAITPDGRTLLIAETFAERIKRFAIEADGSLRTPEIVANLPAPPDGLCLDNTGALWIALPVASKFIRVDASGQTLDALQTPAPFTVACAFGGPQRRTLFLCSAYTSLPQLARGESRGRIDIVDVTEPGAGWP